MEEYLSPRPEKVKPSQPSISYSSEMHRVRSARCYDPKGRQKDNADRHTLWVDFGDSAALSFVGGCFVVEHGVGVCVFSNMPPAF
jgi:hypothetical protein